MEFLRKIEGELQALSTEAKKRYPEVTEAAERAILRLRGMREQYATALRRSGGEAPPLSMFRSQDLLRPFLLACNHADATPKLIATAILSVQHLINRDTVNPSDAPNVMRILAIQAGSLHADTQLRVLQTLVIVITWCGSNLSEETVSQALGICLTLYEAKNATVRDAAYMTVKQIVSILFDTMDKNEENASNHGKNSRTKCAYTVFSNLCTLSGGDGMKSFRHKNISKALGLELIEQALSSHPSLFQIPDGPCSEVMKLELCPLIIQILKGRVDFPLLVRLLRIAETVMVNHGENLLPQSEVMLFMLLQFISGSPGKSGYPQLQNSHVNDDDTGGLGSINLSTGGKETPWTAMLALEVFRHILGVPTLFMKFYISFDLADTDPSPLVMNVVYFLSQYILSRSNAQPVLTVESMEVAAAEQQARGGHLGGKGLSDLLVDIEPPPLPDRYPLLEALLCILDVINVFSVSTWSLVGPENEKIILPLPRVIAEDATSGALLMLIRGSWGGILASVSQGLAHFQSMLVLERVLHGIEKLAIACGIWGVDEGMNACILSLCHFALPNGYKSNAGAGLEIMLSVRHMHIIAAIPRLVHRLGNYLSSDSWHACLEIIDQLDGAFIIGRDCEDMKVEIQNTIARFVYFSKYLQGLALNTALQALVSLSSGAMMQDPVQLRSSMPKDRGQKANLGVEQGMLTSRIRLPYLLEHNETSGFKNAGFSTTCVIACAHANNYRLGTVWGVVSDHLNSLASNTSKEIRDAAIRTLNDFMLQELLGLPTVDEPVMYSMDSSTDMLRLSWVFRCDHEASAIAGNMENPEHVGGALFEAVGQMAQTPYVGTKEAALSALHSVLQSSGQLIGGSWGSVLKLLTAVAQGSSAYSSSTSAWGGSCLLLAFNSLKLIVDDFLDRVPPEEVQALVICIGSFGTQVESVNLSLTAVGMLWTVSDVYTNTFARADMWNSMFEQLRNLSLDDRSEVRNCAVNTYFSVISGNGGTFDDDQWQQYLIHVTFPLLHSILSCTREASDATAAAPELKKGIKAVMHHTRDTDRKQWSETSVLAMQGLLRVMRNFARDLGLKAWFTDIVWPKVLTLYRDACLLGESEQEVSSAGIESLSMLVQIVSSKGLNLKVRISSGMLVVDGALENCSRTIPMMPKSPEHKFGDEFEINRKKLWLQAWETMRSASRLKSNENDESAGSLARAFIETYRSGTTAEFEYISETRDNTPIEQLLDALDSLISRQDNSLNSHVPRRLSIAERSVLDFIKDELPGCWSKAIDILSKYSFRSSMKEDSDILTKESSKVLLYLIKNRLPAAAKFKTIPSLLRLVAQPFRSHIDTYSVYSGSESMTLSNPLMQVCTYWPASPRSVELLHQFKSFIDNGFESDEAQIPICLIALESLSAIGISWAQGDLHGSLENQADFGEEFSKNFLDSLEHIVLGVQTICLPRVIDTPVSSEACLCISKLIDTFGDICSVMGASHSFIPEDESCFLYLLTELIGASKGDSTYIWSVLPISLKRRATYQVFRCCRSAIVCYALMDKVLSDDAHVQPLSIAETRCLKALDVISDLDQFAIQNRIMISNALFDQISEIAEEDISDYPFREHPYIPEDLVFSTENEIVLGRGVGYLMPLYPLLLLVLGTRSRTIREVSMSLLSKLNVPGTVKRYWGRIEGMYSTIQMLRSENEESRKKL